MSSIVITRTSQPGGRLRREGLLKRVWVESAWKRAAEIWGQEQKKAGPCVLWRAQDRGFLLRMRGDGRMQPPRIQGRGRGARDWVQLPSGVGLHNSSFYWRVTD